VSTFDFDNCIMWQTTNWYPNSFILRLYGGQGMWKNNSIPYIYQKRDIYYFSRRVPKDLEDRYRSSKITLSLRTKLLKVAKTKSDSLASQLDEEWLMLHWRRNYFHNAKLLIRQVRSLIKENSHSD